MGVAQAGVRPLDSSPSVLQLPSIPKIPAQELRLDQISAGVDAMPTTEVFNGLVEGFEVEVAGERYLVTIQRHHPDGFTEDLPESVSFQLVGSDSQPADNIEMFRLLPHYSGPRREYFAQQLENAVRLLQDPDSFEAGRQLLSYQLADGIVLREHFTSSSENFAILPHYQDSQLLVSDLRNWLKCAGVNTKQWGRGEAKDIEDLATELLTGEGLLTIEGGTVYLANRVALMWIESPDRSTRLMETRQELPGGRHRKRRSLGGLPAEKIKPSETPEMGARRLLAEELGIHARIPLSASGSSRRLYDSQCYPGVVKCDSLFFFKAQLPESQLRGSYREVHGEKITKFGWVKNPDQPSSLRRDSAGLSPKLLEFLSSFHHLHPFLPF